MRKIIQITACADDRSPDRLYALCDDGTVWIKRMALAPMYKSPGSWVLVDNVPVEEFEEGIGGYLVSRPNHVRPIAMDDADKAALKELEDADRARELPGGSGSVSAEGTAPGERAQSGGTPEGNSADTPTVVEPNLPLADTSRESGGVLDTNGQEEVPSVALKTIVQDRGLF